MIVLAYIAIAIFSFLRIDSKSHSASDTLINFIPRFIIVTILLIIICYRTGEKPHWQWGKKNDKK